MRTSPLASRAFAWCRRGVTVCRPVSLLATGGLLGVSGLVLDGVVWWLGRDTAPGSAGATAAQMALAAAALHGLLLAFAGFVVVRTVVRRTENRRRVRSLEGSKRTLEGFLAASNNYHVMATLDGRFEGVSRGWEVMLGVPRSELIGRPFLDWVHPEDFEPTVEAMGVLRHGEAVEGFQNRYRTADGTYRTLHWNAEAADGHIFATARDFTQEDAHAARLTWLTGVLEEAQEVSRMGSWSFDLVTGEVWWSRELYRLYQRDPELGPPDYEGAVALYAESDAERLEAAVLGATSEGKPYDLTLRLADPANPVRWIRAVGRVRRDDSGAIVGLAGTVADVTESVARERALDAARHAAEAGLRAKGEFLANVSHEIRTPLTSILGFAELLDRDDPPKDAVEAIRRNGRHLLDILNDVLDTSRIEAGMLKIEAVAVDPFAVIGDAAALLRDRAERAGLELRVDRLGPCPAAVMTDPLRLRQIAMNLIGNALKFTEAGSVVVEVSHEAGSGGRLRMRVRDTGIGMSPEQLSVVRRFDAFRQADGSMTRRYGGSGLGLRITNELTRLMGGSMTVESEAGVGSTFTVELLAPAAATTAGAGTPSVSARTASLEGVRLLLAEDGPDTQRLIAFLLRRAGAEVEVVGDGRAAMDRVLASLDAFDVVLMDMQMPVMDGYTAVRGLRAAGVPVPIVALTARAMDGDRARCLAAGCDDYLPKPIDADRLLSVCAGWSEARRAAS